MNDIRRIDEFLELMAGAAKSGYNIDEKTVYINLIHMGNGTQDIDISFNFNGWIRRFSYNPNIDVYVAPDWKYFCQFVSKGNKKNNSGNEVKLYIPLDKEHIYEGANQLFDFLTSENICHTSKIGKHIRFDDIVVRVNNQEDADKVINFVNNNLYLKEGRLPLNPFAVHDGNVSVAWDGYLSYNSVVANWISEYINFEKENNNLDDVSYSSFYNYVSQMCDLLFEKGIGIREHYKRAQMNGLFSSVPNGDISYRLLNYYDVTRLLVSHLESNLKREDVYKYIDKVSDSNYRLQRMNKIARLYYEDNSFKAIHSNANNNDENTLDKKEYLKQKKEVLRKSFIYMYEKYGYDETRIRFLSFMKDGNYDRITRYKGARKLLIDNNITKEILTEIAKEWAVKNMNIENTMNLAFYDTYDKYDYYQAFSAIKKIFMERDFSQITNRNGYRLQLMNQLADDEFLLHIMEILTRNGYKIEYSDVENLFMLYISKFDVVTNRRGSTL